MCWDVNETIEYKVSEQFEDQVANAKRVTLYIKFEPPRTTFPKVKEWYDGREGTVRRLTDGRWRVDFEVDIKPNESIHVGWDFEDSVEFELGGHSFTSASGTKLEMGAAGIGLGTDEQGQNAVVVWNADDATDAITVEGLVGTVLPKRISLAALETGHADWEALRLRSLGIDAPLVLQPGERKVVYSIPQERLGDAESFVARVTSRRGGGNEDPLGGKVESFRQGPIAALRQPADPPGFERTEEPDDNYLPRCTGPIGPPSCDSQAALLWWPWLRGHRHDHGCCCCCCCDDHEKKEAVTPLRVSLGYGMLPQTGTPIYTFVAPAWPGFGGAYQGLIALQWSVTGGTGQVSVTLSIVRGPNAGNLNRPRVFPGSQGNFVFRFNARGTYVFQARARDATGRTNTTQFSVSV